MARDREIKGLAKAGPKGLAKARRGGTFLRRAGEALSRDAVECLFRHAEVLSEGEIRDADDTRSYFGSTMITFPLDQIAECWRGPLDGEAQERLRVAVEGSVRVRLRAMRMATAEAARRVPVRPLGTAVVETHVRLAGGKLLLDVDLEVPIGVSSRRRKR